MRNNVCFIYKLRLMKKLCRNLFESQFFSIFCALCLVNKSWRFNKFAKICNWFQQNKNKWNLNVIFCVFCNLWFNFRKKKTCAFVLIDDDDGIKNRVVCKQISNKHTHKIENAKQTILLEKSMSNLYMYSLRQNIISP